MEVAICIPDIIFYWVYLQKSWERIRFEEPRGKPRGVFDRKEFYLILIAPSPRSKLRKMRSLLRFKESRGQGFKGLGSL